MLLMKKQFWKLGINLWKDLRVWWEILEALIKNIGYLIRSKYTILMQGKTQHKNVSSPQINS